MPPRRVGVSHFIRSTFAEQERCFAFPTCRHAGYALRDCIKGAGLPYVEVHVTNVEARGIRCVITPVAKGVVFGLGVHSYVLGLEAMLHLLSGAKA